MDLRAPSRVFTVSIHGELRMRWRVSDLDELWPKRAGVRCHPRSDIQSLLEHFAGVWNLELVNSVDIVV